MTVLLALPAGARATDLTSVGPLFATGQAPHGIAYSPNGRFLAVANAQDGTVSMFVTQPDGSLASAGPPVMADGGAEAVAFDPTGRLLAVANRTAGTISVFSTSSTGVLTPTGVPVLTGNGPVALAFTPNGRRLIVALHDDSALQTFKLNEFDQLVPTGAPFEILGLPTALAISSRGHVAVATAFTPKRPYYIIYTLDANGDLNQTPVSMSMATNSEPCAVAFSPDGKWLVKSDCYELYDMLYVSGINADGTPHGSSRVMMPRPAYARSLAFTADGRFLATANAEGKSITVFRNNEDGTLSPVNAPAQVNSPYAVAFSPAGFLAATDSSGDGVAVFRLNDQGGLVPLGGRTSNRRGQALPGNVTFSPDRRFLATATDFFAVGRDGRLRSLGYPAAADFGTSPLAFSADGSLLARSDGASVEVFTVAIDGTLTQAGGVSLYTPPTNLAFSPDGRFLIAAGADGDVTTFSVLLGGALSQAGPMFFAGSPWRGWRFSPDGQLLAAVLPASNLVGTFSFSENGALAFVSSGTLPWMFGLEATPGAVAFHPGGRLLATTDAGRSTVSTFVVGANGSLTSGETETINGDLTRGAVFSPTSGALVAVTENGTTTLLSAAADGTLTKLAPSSRLDSRPTALTITNDGAFVAAANTNATVTVFALLAAWARPAIADAPVAAAPSTTATVTFNTNYPSTTECRVDATAFAPCESPWTVSDLADGSHRVTIRAIDLAGNVQGSVARTWTVDTTAPEAVGLVRPLAGTSSMRADRQTFSWSSVTDDLTGIDRYELRVDGHLARTMPPPSCGSTCTATLTDPLADGPHRWEVGAVDGAGNVSSSETRTFAVDATPPEDAPVPTSPGGDLLVATSRPDFAWRPATDAGSGLQSYDVQVDDRTLAAALPPSSTGWTPPVDLADGAHSWRVVATDVNGNRQPSAAGRFTIDTTPPTASLVPTPDPALSGRTIAFDASGSQDALGGEIVRYEWDLDGDGVFESSSSTPSATRIYTTTAKLTVPITVRVTDRAGLTATVSRTTRVFADSTSKPPGFTIDDQARYTNEERVTLSVLAPSFATEIEVSNDGSFLSSETFKVTPTVPWKLDLAGADREARTVYLRFRRGAIFSDQFTDDIILDQLPPVIKQAATGVRKGQPIVQVQARDQGLSGIDGVQVTNDTKHPPDEYTDASFRAQRAEIKLKSQRSRTASTAVRGAFVVDLKRPMYMRLRDRAGNVTRWKRVQR